MFDFVNPEFLWVGVALISVPIIIHLINRLRFKRLPWAAMEFLLKAQKKNRRRLIIEQLILLALRCLLVALVGLLVMRFTGFSAGSKQSLHIVLLDDTLSMTDKVGDKDKSCFQRAKSILTDKLATKMTAGDRLLVLPLSKVGSGEDPKPTEKLNDAEVYGTWKKEHIDPMEPTRLHLSLADGVQWARRIADEDPNSPLTLHVLSDFRRKDWGLAEGSQLYAELLKFGGERKAKIRLVDTADPERNKKEGGAPPYHENVGIVELKPRIRIAGKDTPVSFFIKVANYGTRDAEVNVAIYDLASGTERTEVNFNPSKTLKIKPGAPAQATFDLWFSPNIKDDETYFAPIQAKLEGTNRGPLTDDGLAGDNTAYTVVEVRNSVPVLVIDGGDSEDLRVSQDGERIEDALSMVPGSSFRVEMFNNELPGSRGVATKILDRLDDLRKYPTIFLLNVRDLTEKRLKNLETFVSEGGGVGFFLGPQVSTKYYNENLFKNGQGIFPVALKDAISPPALDIPLAKRGKTPMLLLRDDLFKTAADYPIFGSIFMDPRQCESLNSLPIHRYFQVVRRPEAKGVDELATLPNVEPIENFQSRVFAIVCQNQLGQPDRLEGVLAGKAFQKYKKGLDRRRQELEKLVKPPFDANVNVLGKKLREMLTDKGKDSEPDEHPNLAEFWSNSDPVVDALAKEIKSLCDQVTYGDPLVMASSFGKGKVVAVMTTAGKGWNKWAGGSLGGETTFLPFVWEMQNYLSSRSSDTNLTVGTPWNIRLENELYKRGSGRLKMERVRLDPEQRSVKGAIPVSRGKGYAIGDLLTVPSGKKDGKATPAVLYVTAVDNGQITEVSTDVAYYPKANPGLYSKDTLSPDRSVDVTGGSGSEAVFKLILEAGHVPVSTKFGEDDKGVTTFSYTDSNEPGVYLSRLLYGDASNKAENPNKKVPVWAQAFNVDTEQEGPLQRVSYDDLKTGVLGKYEGEAIFRGISVTGDELVPRRSDLSESPLFFLLLLTVLVAEQALAVHLSFHLKKSEGGV